MDAMTCLLSRQSVAAGMLGEPVPDDAELGEVFASAMRAPDHGALRPWRFLLIRGRARESLGELYAGAALRAMPGLPESEIDKARAKPLRSPLVIAVWAQVTEAHPKVPPIEQVIATGAAAQNVLNALYAKGYGAILVTGKPCYDEEVKAALGLEPKDALVGFIYVGTPVRQLPVKERSDAGPFVAEWTGAVARAAAAE